MNWKRLTGIVIILATITLLLYDVLVIAESGTDNSISWILLSAAHKHPVIPFAWGVLSGHLFFSQED